MTLALVLGAALIVVIVFLLALFPTPGSPRWWRHNTRPLRRLLRPGHYRSW
jgi:hypothetical protein